MFWQKIEATFKAIGTTAFAITGWHQFLKNFSDIAAGTTADKAEAALDGPVAGTLFGVGGAGILTWAFYKDSTNIIKGALGTVLAGATALVAAEFAHGKPELASEAEQELFAAKAMFVGFLTVALVGIENGSTTLENVAESALFLANVLFGRANYLVGADNGWNFDTVAGLLIPGAFNLGILAGRKEQLEKLLAYCCKKSSGNGTDYQQFGQDDRDEQSAPTPPSKGAQSLNGSRV